MEDGKKADETPVCTIPMECPKCHTRLYFITLHESVIFAVDFETPLEIECGKCSSVWFGKISISHGRLTE